MPIVHCTLSPELSKGLSYEDNPGHQNRDNKLIKRWAEASGVSAEDMTINLLEARQQLGKACQIMASLVLPSMWSRGQISDLQLGLARALAEHFSIPLDEVHVITTVVGSGMVVESGKELTWS